MKANLALWMRAVIVFTTFITIVGCFDAPADATPRRARNRVKATATLPPQSSRLCLMFRESLWQEFRFGEDSQDEVIQTVISHWDGQDESQILSEDLYGNDVHWGVGWRDDSRRGGRVRYYAVGGNVRKLVYVRVQLDPGPTLAQILACLGPPEFYGTDTPPDFVNGLGLGLWYVEKGFMVSGLTHGGKARPTEFSLEFPMDTFHAAPRGDLHKMVIHLGSPSLHMAFLCQLRPWPGAIEEIVIEAFNGNARC